MRTPVLAVMALALGLAAAGGTYYYITTSKPQDPEFDVVVAKENVPPNRILRKEMFEVVKKKKSELGDNFERYVREGEKTEGINTARLTDGRRSRSQLTKGRPILLDLETEDMGPVGIQSRLKEGEEAVTVATNPNESGAGLLRPGMYVDVVVKFRDPNTGDDRIAMLFDYAVEVMAVNIFEANPPENTQLMPERVILRMKTWDDAARMKYFKDIGTISLFLPYKDKEEKDRKLVKRTFDPKNDPLFTVSKKEQKEPTEPPKVVTDSRPNQQQPSEKGSRKIKLDRTTSIFTGNDVKTYDHSVEQEIPAPPRPGTPEGGAGTGTSTGDKKPAIYGNEADKKETEKGAPNKDAAGGAEAPKKSGGPNK